MIELKLTGEKELLAKFKQIKLDMANVFAAGLVAGAAPVVHTTKVNAPHVTGNLMRSYHVGTKTRNITEPQATDGAPQIVSKGGVAVVADELRQGRTAKVYVGTDVVYAPPQEFLHKPHLRPALQSNQGKVNAEVRRAIKMMIKKASL